MSEITQDQFFDAAKGSEHACTLTEGAFVMFLSNQPGGNASVGVSVSPTSLKAMSAAASMTRVLKQVRQGLGSGKISCKFIAEASLVGTLDRELKALGVEVENGVARALPVELVYLPKESRLRAAQPAEKLRVLVVDDSPTIRNLLTQVFHRDPGIQVVATAEKPSEVEALILKHKPQVMTLDIHMPEMDGVTLLKKIFPKYRIPTVMVSSISMEEGPLVLEALEIGAVDYIQKPTLDRLNEFAPMIMEKTKAAAKANLQKMVVQKKASPSLNASTYEDKSVVVIGSSTGGTEALKQVFSGLPAHIPPTVIVQHIPPVFSKAFADRMNDLFPFTVKEAENDDELLPDQILIAPGGMQLRVVDRGGKLKVVIEDTAPVNRHKPSVDVLFDSVVPLVGKRPFCAVILTGMGGDGAKGMKKLRDAGARTIAQNEETCVVYGMPREAVKLGAADEILPLQDIPAAIFKALSKKTKKSA